MNSSGADDSVRVAQQPSVADQVLEQVRVAIAPVLRSHHVELFDLSLQVRKHSWLLTVTIDTPATAPGGVTVDMCAEVSRDVSAVLDVDDPIAHPYTLVVSSPGVERPLRSAADYERFVGRLAKVVLIEALEDGQKAIRGHIREVDGDRLSMEQEHGESVWIGLSNIKKANLVYEEPAKKKRTSARHKKKSSKRR